MTKKELKEIYNKRRIAHDILSECDAELEKRSREGKKQRLKQVANHEICIRCGKPISDLFKYCLDCLEEFDFN